MSDTAAHLPKYLQISHDIVSTIRSGKLSVGDMTMSENEIIETYDVSNTTARKALQELEHAGWVRRIKGKGTVVKEKRIGRSVDAILGFTKNMREAGREPSTKLLGIHRREEGHSVTVNERQYTLSGPVYVLERLRLADGVPIMEETRYISARLCPGLDEKDLEGSLYDIYEREYGFHLSRVDQVLRTTLIEDVRLMELFDLEDPTPAFSVEGVSFYGREVALEMEQSLYRGDKYRFTVTANR